MGRSYAGIPMHAAPGVHEHALRLVKAKVHPKARILDVGTGSGALSARLHDAGFDVLACDLDASDYVAPPPIVEWNAAAATLHESLAPEASMRSPPSKSSNTWRTRCRRCATSVELLKPGGVLIVSTPNVGHPRSRLKFFLTGAPSYFGRTEYFSSGIARSHGLAARIAHQGSWLRGCEPELRWVAGAQGTRRSSLTRDAARVQRAGMLPKPRSSDGCVTFAVGYRPN